MVNTRLYEPKIITMKSLFSLMAATLLFSITSAQEEVTSSNRIHEIGLAFSNLDNFGLVYHIGND